MKKYLITIVLLVTCKASSAYELLVGIQSTAQNIWIEDTNIGPDEIAKIEMENSYTPSLTLRTDAKYFKRNNWGYHIQYDFSIFSTDMQNIEAEELVDYGTRIDGSALYVVPVFFYHFNRSISSQWNYKAGIGVGVGYMSINGTFKITDTFHPQFGTVENVDLSDFGLAVGVYFEAGKGNHILVAQNYGPVIEDENYEYQLHNLLLSYKYVFNF